MKVSTNKSKKTPSSEMKVDTSVPTSSNKDLSQPPTYSVEPIKNGFLVRKSWNDKEGHYRHETEFRNENPLELEVTKK